METIELSVGQNIYLEPIGNASRYNSQIIETTVTKIGRKYFEVSGRYGRFELKTFAQDNGQHSSNYKAYLSKQEIEIKNESQQLLTLIRNHFYWLNQPKLSIDKLRNIVAIINS